MLVYDQVLKDQKAKPADQSLGWVAKSVFNHKLIIATSVIVGTVASAGAYVSITPMYEASTLLLVGQNAGGDDWEAAKRATEMVSSHARIAESEEVLRDAIEQVGLDRLGIEAPANTGGLGDRLRELVLGAKAEPRKTVSPIDNALFQVGKSISVAPEARSNVIKISFKHPDPVIAALFANTLAQSFIDRQIKLSDKPGALEFFRIQKGRFDAEVEHRSSNFESFVKKQRAYSIVDQRTLLLKRASEIAAALTITRTSLADKRGQRSALVSQLKLLRPVTLSPFVSSLVDTLGNEDRSGGIARSAAPFADRTTAGGDPPLLMVRVYQDEMVALFKANADIKGLQDQADQQQKEFDTINEELASLIGHQTEFERLKREVGLAIFNAELYAKRTVAEQIESDLRTAKLSNIKIFQPALVPMQAGFPNVRVFLGLGASAGAMIGMAFAVLLETSRKSAAPSAQPAKASDVVAKGSSPKTPSDRKPSSQRLKRAQRRNTGRSPHRATPVLDPAVVTSASNPSGRTKTAQSLRKFALVCLLGLVLAGVAMAASVNDTRAADQLLEWARTNWMLASANRS